MLVKMSFDIGNGFVKAVSNNEEKVFIAPSSFAKKSALGESSISDLFDKGTDQYNVFESSLDDGTEYIWGEKLREAISPNKLIHTYTHENRYNNKRFKLLCQFVLAELASQYEEDTLDVVLVTGMPSAEIKTDLDAKLKEFLKKKHLVKRNGVEKVINVVDVRLLEQPLGTLLNKYLLDGKMHKNLTDNTITVIDFGSGTTIIDTYKGMKRIDDQSRTIYQGMNDIYKAVQRKLSAKYNLKTLDQLQIEEGFRNGYVLKISERSQYPFEQEAKEAIVDTIDQIVSEIDRIVAVRENIDEFVVTGGGANAVGEYFKDVFGEESLDVVKDSQTANVHGYDKFCSLLVNNMQSS